MEIVHSVFTNLVNAFRILASEDLVQSCRWFIFIVVFFLEGTHSISYIVTHFVENLLCVNMMLGADIAAVNKAVVVSALMAFPFRQERYVTELITRLLIQLLSLLRRAPGEHTKGGADLFKMSERAASR